MQGETSPPNDTSRYTWPLLLDKGRRRLPSRPGLVSLIRAWWASWRRCDQSLGARGTISAAQGMQGAGELRSGAPQDSTQADAGDEGEEVRASTKVSTHRRYTRRGPRSAVTHASIRQYTFCQDSTRLQQARHSESVWRDNHVLTTTPISQGTEPAEAGTPHRHNPRTLTKTTDKNRKRRREDPRRYPRVRQTLRYHPYWIGIIQHDAATEGEDIDVYNDLYDDVHTDMNVTTPP